MFLLLLKELMVIFLFSSRKVKIIGHNMAEKKLFTIFALFTVFQNWLKKILPDQCILKRMNCWSKHVQILMLKFLSFPNLFNIILYH